METCTNERVPKASRLEPKSSISVPAIRIHLGPVYGQCLSAGTLVPEDKMLVCVAGLY